MRGWESEGVSFEYPVSEYKDVNYLEFGKIVTINEFLYKGLSDESYGLLFEFESGDHLAIIETDDDVKIKWSDKVIEIKDCVISTYQW